MLVLRHGTHPGCEPAENGERERRAIEDRLLEVPRGEGDAARRFDRDDLGDARQAVEDRQLTKEFPGAEDRHLFAVADDPDRTFDDEEEPGSDLPLPGNHAIGREFHLDRPLGDRVEVLAPDACEEPARTEQLASTTLCECQPILLHVALMLPLAVAGVNLRGPPNGRMREGLVPVPERSRFPMASSDEIVDQIAGFALFADLETPQLERVAHTFEEQWYAEGERVLRQGLSGSAFHIILEGDAAVVIDGQERAKLSRGDFFGEVSILLGEPPVADVVAVHQLRCLVLAGPQVRSFLLDNPSVMYRMLQAQARRLRNANRWRS